MHGLARSIIIALSLNHELSQRLLRTHGHVFIHRTSGKVAHCLHNIRRAGGGSTFLFISGYVVLLQHLETDRAPYCVCPGDAGHTGLRHIYLGHLGSVSEVP